MCVMTRDVQRGSTLVEVLIALVLIVVTFTGLAQLLAITMARVQDSRRQAMAAWLAASKLEQLQALTWRVRFLDDLPVLLQDESTDLRFEPARTGGPGTRPSAGEMDYLDSWGRWVSAGETRPDGVAYQRRWSVVRRGEGASELLVFEVAVADLARLGGRVSDWRRSPYVVRLHGARLRRASN